jgi:hypothetical protein
MRQVTIGYTIRDRDTAAAYASALTGHMNTIVGIIRNMPPYGEVRTSTRAGTMSSVAQAEAFVAHQVRLRLQDRRGKA